MNETSTASGPVAAEMLRRLGDLNPTRLDLIDESDDHIGHAGHDARGESHFYLSIESAQFEGLNRVQRQRLVYKALGDLMHDRVHALQMKTLPPGKADPA